MDGMRCDKLLAGFPPASINMDKTIPHRRPTLGLTTSEYIADTLCRSCVSGTSGISFFSHAQPAVACRLWEVSPWAATRCHPSHPVRRTRPGLCTKAVTGCNQRGAWWWMAGGTNRQYCWLSCSIEYWRRTCLHIVGVEFIFTLPQGKQNTCLTRMSLSHRCPMAPEKMPTPRCVSMHQENHWNMYYWNVIKSTHDCETWGSPWLPPRLTDDITPEKFATTCPPSLATGKSMPHGITESSRTCADKPGFPALVLLLAFQGSWVQDGSSVTQWWGLCLIRRFRRLVINGHSRFCGFCWAAARAPQMLDYTSQCTNLDLGCWRRISAICPCTPWQRSRIAMTRGASYPISDISDIIY